MRAWDFAIDALSPFDNFQWQKYFEVTKQLDQFNWVDCLDFEDLSQVLEKDAAWYNDWYAQEDSEQLSD